MIESTVPRREILRYLAAASVLGTSATFAHSAETSSQMPPSDLFDRLFIMDTWFWENKLDASQQADILKRLGSRKATESRNRWDEFPQVLETFDRSGIEMVAVYVRLSIGDRELPDFFAPLIDCLKGHNTLIWLNLVSQSYKPSDAEGDKDARKIVLAAADLAEQAGLSISLYHHRGDWMERIGDTFRLAETCDRKNVGCTFNLYHWLFNDGGDHLEETAKKVLPRLNCITINGAMKNTAAIDVREAILPLGEGDYDVEQFVRTFIKLGYRGPIGMQGYGIGGEIEKKMADSLEVWRGYCGRIQ